MHSYIHTYIHTHIHTNIHVYMHVCVGWWVCECKSVSMYIYND